MAMKRGMILICLLALTSSESHADDGQNVHTIDLSHWKLTLPVDAQGGHEGTAVEVQTTDLLKGFTDKRYFYRGPKGALVFWAPVTGATTKGSEYPRSELREVIHPADDNVNWTPEGSHLLEATCIVQRVPSTQKVVVGQIHGFSGKARPLIKLQYSKGSLVALVKQSPGGDTDTKWTLATVPLGTPFQYQIKLHNGQLTVDVNGNSQSVNILKNDPAWAKQTMYFKAGAYTQDNEGNSTEGAEVLFETLRIQHL